jgi:DNA-binding NarL/FixJ family response regulator
MNTPIKVAMADDHQTLLDTMMNHFSALQPQTLIEMVWTANSKEKLLEKLRTSRFLPDILLLDISFKNSSSDEGILACEVIRKKYPQIKVIFFTQIGEELSVTVRRALALKPEGYLLKTKQFKDLLDVIRQVQRGFKFCDPEVQHLTEEELIELTPREKEVLLLTCRYGLRPADIAKKLSISVHTVNTHKKNLKNKVVGNQCADFTLRQQAHSKGYLDLNSK